MSVDQATVRRIAHLARIAVSDAEVPHLQGEINAILPSSRSSTRSMSTASSR